MWYFYTPVIVHVISYITLHFTHVRSIEMCHVFVLLCSLHSSVWCGLWLNMCDIWSVVYTRRTYYISFHMPRLHNIPSIALRCTKRKQIPAQLFYSLISSWFGYTNWCVWCLVCISCQTEIIHVVSYTPYYALRHHCSRVEVLLGVTDQ